jgi:hypothetical protein
MYVVNSPITFTINRTINPSPTTISSVRVVDPTGDISLITAFTTNTNPTASVPGLLVFSHTPTEPGLYEYEIQSASNSLMLKNIYLLVVTEDTTYTNTITV